MGELVPGDDDDYDIECTEVVHGDPAAMETLQGLEAEERKAQALVADLTNKLAEAKNSAKEQKMAATQKAKVAVGQQEAAAPEPEPKFEVNEEDWVYKGDPNDRKVRRYSFCDPCLSACEVGEGRSAAHACCAYQNACDQ